MASKPTASAKPQVSAKLSLIDRQGAILPGSIIDNVGYYFSKCEFKAMVNGGYTIKLILYDAGFVLHSEMIKKGYFTEARSHAILLKFQIFWGDPRADTWQGDTTGQVAVTAAELELNERGRKTLEQQAIIISMKAYGENDDRSHIEFIAIDPAAFYLNMGDGSGAAFYGRVDKVIQDVVRKYYPLCFRLDISETSDHKTIWYMMRQDPKTFLSSLIDWSSSITEKKTHWIIAPDGFDLDIKEQAAYISEQRADYTYSPSREVRASDILEFDVLAENALASIETKIITQGMSAVSGEYLDRITDKKEEYLFVKDSTTPNKLIPKVGGRSSFKKPVEGAPPVVGWTSVNSIPEFNAGDMGLNYRNYIDGRARGLYLNLAQATFRARIVVNGHGEWNSNKGLGVDTIVIRWSQVAQKFTQADPEAIANDLKKDAAETEWWMTGNWMVYGFHHKVTRGSWTTDLYITRYDFEATGLPVSGESINFGIMRDNPRQ